MVEIQKISNLLYTEEDNIVDMVAHTLSAHLKYKMSFTLIKPEQSPL